jgi:hypothetical protein
MTVQLQDLEVEDSCAGHCDSRQGSVFKMLWRFGTERLELVEAPAVARANSRRNR